MRFLGIHYHFPPVKTVGAVRLYNFYTHLRPYTEPPHILTSAHRRKLRQDEALRVRRVHLHALPTYDLRGLNLARYQATKTAHVDSSLRRHPLVDLLSRLNQSFPFNMMWGDGGLVYILAGYRRGCRLVERSGITHLFSSYRPYCDHAVAYLLKRRYPHLVWVADFRDLHVDPGRRNVLWPELQTWFNRQVLARADVVTTVSEGLADRLEEYHDKVYVLRNGIGERPAVESEGMEREKGDAPADDAFRITYTGSLYPGKQSAAALLEGLQRIAGKGIGSKKDLALVYAGKDASIWRSWLAHYRWSGYQETHGLVDLRDARLLQKRSHLNLLLTWSSPDQAGILTAKLYEYLNAGTPILALIQGAPDPELTELVEGSGVGRVFNSQQHGVEEVLAYLEALYRRWRATGSTAVAIPEAVLAPRRWAALMAGFVAFLEKEGNR